MTNSFSLSKTTWLGWAAWAVLTVYAAAQANKLPTDMLITLAGLAALGLIALLRLSHHDIWHARIHNVVARIAMGDFEARLVHATRGGHLRPMLGAINDAIDVTDAFVREAGAAMAYVADNKYFRLILTRGMRGAFHHHAETINNATRAMGSKIGDFDKLAKQFENTAKHVAESVAAAANELQATAGAMSSTAQRVSEQASSVADSAGELSQSIQHITQEVGQSTRLTAVAVARAETSSGLIGGLEDAVRAVQKVVTLINDIAKRTTMLSLNATIESVRAGEAGKGFAVVAAEVKSLADQTAKATDEITAQMEAMTSTTQETITAIKDIAEAVNAVSGAMSGITTAVQRQESATHRMIHDDGTGNGIDGVKQSAITATSAADETLTAARDLSVQSERLNAELDQFFVAARRVTS